MYNTAILGLSKLVMRPIRNSFLGFSFERVTGYYAAPTQIQISDTIEDIQDNWLSYIDIHQGIQRSPEELKNAYDEYKEKVGTVSKVVGGICTIDAVCPTKMACMGCAAKSTSA